MSGKMLMKRIICYMLMLIMLTGTVSGCNSKKTGKSSKADQTITGTVNQPTSKADQTNTDIEENTVQSTPPAQSGTPVQNSTSGSTAPEPVKVGTNAGRKDILTIAEKYYHDRLPLLHPDLKEEFAAAAGKVNFSGAESLSDISSKLCNLASVETAFSLNGDFAVLTATSAIAKDADNADAAHTLSAVLLEAMFLTDANRLEDALACVSYAISIQETWKYDYTLSQIYAEMEKYDEAFTAIDRALVLDPGNFACIDFKVVLLKKMGGSATAIKTLEKEAEKNDGDLGKRLKKQENATEGYTQPSADESKEELEKKFNEFIALKPITISDLFTNVYPEEAAKLQEKIMKVSESDKFKLPAFPDKLFKTAKIIEEDCFDEATEYAEWLNDSINDLVEQANKDYQKAYQDNYAQQAPQVGNSRQDIVDKAKEYQEMLENLSEEQLEQWMEENVLNMLPQNSEGSQAQMNPPETAASDKTNVEFMMHYNMSVVNAGVYSFAFYALALNKEFIDTSIEANQFMSDKVIRYEKQKRTEMDNAPEEEKPVIALKYELMINAACEEYVRNLLPQASRDYARITNMAHEVWAEVLPYLRSSHMPEVYIPYYQSVIIQHSLLVLSEVTFLRGTPYNRFISDEDLEAAEEALEEYRQYMEEVALAAANSGSEIQLSLDLKIVKINITPNSAELEVMVKIVAARVQYDWKKDQVEVGAGVGASLDGGAKLIKVEAKMLANVVIDLRKNNISDIYVNSEASASIGGYGVEGGGKISLLGKGSSTYSGITAERGSVSVKHKQELISE